MAARSSGKSKNGSFEGIDKVASSTLKRHPKMELNKGDLLRLLSYLEGELQARDITIAALKTEKAKQLLYQAKYGRFGLGDPFLALQRGVDGQKDNCFDESAIKTMYDNQLTQLENLIATQRKAQHRMREQLCAVEKRYHKVCAELEDEKRKHAQDTAQGDDVTYMLEKERERLRQEIDFEKGQNKKLEKDLKKATTALEEEKANSNKHKQVAIMLIKERKKLVEKLFESEQLQTLIEHSLIDEKNKARNMAEGLMQESQKSLHMEAALEKQLLEFDVEREQLKKRLNREENRNADLVNWNKELSGQVEELQQQLEAIQWQVGVDRRDVPKSIEIRSSVNKAPVNKEQAKEVILNSISGMQSAAQRVNQPKLFKNTPPNTPPEVRKFSHVRESPEREGSPSSQVQRSYMNNSSPNLSPDRTVISDMCVMPVPMGQESPAQRYNINTSGPPGTHVFTTPSGSKISVHVGTPAAAQNRKPVPMGRGQPPPIPPNKPIYIPQNNARKDVNIGGVRSPSTVRPETMSPVLGESNRRPLPPAKLANPVMTKDKTSAMMALSPESPNENIKQFITSGAAPSPRQIPIPVAHHTSGPAPASAPLSAGDGMRKASQSERSAVCPAADYCVPSLADIHDNDMNDLQQLLVSMVTGESSASSIEESNTSSSSSSSSSASTPDIHNFTLYTSDIYGHSPKLINPNEQERHHDILASKDEIINQIAANEIDSQGNQNGRLCTVQITMSQDHSFSSDAKAPTICSYAIGSVHVLVDTTWSFLEEELCNILCDYFNALSRGIKSKKISKLDSEQTTELSSYSLDLSLNSVKFYCIGLYNWSPGTPSEKKPFDILFNNDCNHISVKMFGIEDDCMDGLAYETLISVSNLSNYLRLIDQYKHVIFYGPGGCGKSYLAGRLAACVLERERNHGQKAEIHSELMNEKYSKVDLVRLLIDSDVLLPASSSSSKSVILVLDSLSQPIITTLAEILGSVDGKEDVPITLDLDGHRNNKYVLSRTCFIIGTLDKVRTTGIELSIQQHFRWVHFRTDSEPMKHLLSRHFYRRLADKFDGQIPAPDNSVFRAVEWVVCVWQRINEGLLKLGLADIVFGPAHFLSCPIEISKPKAILRWVSLLWNHMISTTVSEAVIKGSETQTPTKPGGQQKVASTALYVLMQRAILPGCPLSGQEKERYLSNLQGSNELDIKIRMEKKEAKPKDSPSVGQIEKPMEMRTLQDCVTYRTMSASHHDSDNQWILPMMLPGTTYHDPDDPRAPPLKVISDVVAKRVAKMRKSGQDRSSIQDAAVLSDEAPLSPVKDIVHKFEMVSNLIEDQTINQANEDCEVKDIVENESLPDENAILRDTDDLNQDSLEVVTQQPSSLSVLPKYKTADDVNGNDKKNYHKNESSHSIIDIDNDASCKITIDKDNMFAGEENNEYVNEDPMLAEIHDSLLTTTEHPQSILTDTAINRYDKSNTAKGVLDNFQTNDTLNGEYVTKGKSGHSSKSSCTIDTVEECLADSKETAVLTEKPDDFNSVQNSSRRLKDSKLPILTQRLRKSSPID